MSRLLILTSFLWATAAHAADPPHAEALRQAARGSPIYLVATAAGVVARSADGTLERVLIGAKATDVTLDAAHDLVWFVRDRKLLALDLLGSGKPVVVVTGLPKNVKYRVIFGAVTPSDALSSHAELAVEVAGKPALRPALVKGMDFEWWYVGGKGEAMLKARVAQAKRARLTGATWLARMATRPARDAGPGVVSLMDGQRIPVPAALAGCDEDPEICGHAAPFGKSGWKLVVTAHSCGDFCYQSCLLHSPANGTWAVPPDTSVWKPAAEMSGSGGCGDYWIDKDEAHVLAASDDGTLVCTLGAACVKASGTPVGWLDPGPTFLVPDVSGPP